MKIQYTLQLVRNLIEIEILPTCVSRCVTRLRKKFRSKFLVIVRKKKRKKQLAAFTKQRLRLDRKLHREIEDERRRLMLTRNELRAVTTVEKYSPPVSDSSSRIVEIR